jgi:plasmid maintenance system antidote protein VapI
MTNQSQIAEAFNVLSKRLGIQSADMAAYLGLHPPNMQNAIMGRRKLSVDALIEMATLDAESAEAELRLMSENSTRAVDTNPNPPDREALSQRLGQLEAELRSLSVSLSKMMESDVDSRRQLSLLQAVRSQLSDGQPVRMHWFDKMTEKCASVRDSYDSTQVVMLRARIAGLEAEREGIQNVFNNLPSSKP